MEVPHKIKHTTTIGPATPLLRIYPQERNAETQTAIRTPVFTAGLFIITNR